MAKPISNEKRAEIIRHMKAGKSKEDIAKWLFVCVRTITRVWNKYTTMGSYEPEPQNSGRKPLVSDETMNQVVSKIKKTPNITLLELIEEFNLPISQSALCRRLINLGFTYQQCDSSKQSRQRGRCQSKGNLVIKPKRSESGNHTTRDIISSD
jgi:transposase